MGDIDRTKKQLIDELTELRQRVAEFGASETERKRAEDALRESEKKYRSLFDNMLNGFAYCKILVDENNQPIDFVHLEVNDAWERLIGLKREDVIGKKVTEAIPGIKESKTGLISIYGEVALTGKEAKFDIYFEPLGKWFTISVYSSQKGYFVAVFDDITERKRGEEALQESEENFRLLAENSNDGIAISHIYGKDTGVRTYVNRKLQELTGYSENELVNLPIPTIIHPSERDRIADIRKRRLAGEPAPQHYDTILLTKDGKSIPVEITASSTVWQGQSAVMVVYRDITEHKRAEEELRASRDYLELLTNSMWDAVFAVRLPDRVIEWANDSFSLTGYEPEDCIGKTTEFLYPDESEFLTFGNKLKSAIAAGKDVLHAEQLLKRKNGEVFPAEITATFFRERGDVIRITSIVRDITERKQAEERERELQQELYLSSRLAAVGELAAGIAHEINNPLTGILGFSERLLRKSTDEKVKHGLETIHNEAQRAARVVRNLLTFARRLEPAKEYSDVNDILQSAVELRAYELETGNIEVVTDLAPSLPGIMVDYNQIEEVFLNIILNAEQVMTEANGGGKLTIKTQQMKDYVRTSFADDGPGIPAEQFDKVFDPFFTTKGERGGTGLGLSACHGIVTDHGGRIYARSKPGKGATFFVELPCR